MPASYSAAWPAGTRVIHGHFNDRNREESSRYVRTTTCDVLFDLLPAAGAADERERSRLHSGFRPSRTAPFLDTARSPAWSRALYVPWLSEKRNAYAVYAMLVRE